MKLTVQQTGLFSYRKLNGYYRYKDLFQLLPVDSSENNPFITFPLLLEIKYCPNIWPDNNNLYWYRDIFEKERFQTIQNKSGKKIDFAEGWGKEYERSTKMLRPQAIFEEISNLLSLFTNHRFFYYRNEGRWFISQGKENDAEAHQWRQVGYRFTFNNSDSKKLSNIESHNPIKKISVSDYHKNIRDAFTLDASDNDITFPENIDRLFDLYFQLHHKDMKVFYKACKLYNQALELNLSHPSLSLVSSATAIEALMGSTKTERNDICNHEISVETCDVCGIPLYNLNSRFKKFFLDYGDNSESTKKFASKFYSFRSLIAHGDLLREDLNDSGFYAGNDEQESFRRNSLRITNMLLTNWLIKTNN